MILIVDDVAEGFGKSLGERAGTALSGWIQNLWNADGVTKRKQLEEIVEPAFKQFLEIYEEYERSFKKYRAELTNADSDQQIRRLVDQIEGDLRFTAKDRVDLLNHLEQAVNTVFEDFVRSIVEFLVCNEESLSGEPEDSLVPREIAGQVMRRGLIADLRAVMAPWAAALDPAASAPPLRGKELQHMLDEIGKRYGIAKDDPKHDGKLRAKLAVERLDSRVDSMVAAYKKVREKYETLKVKLSS